MKSLHGNCLHEGRWKASLYFILFPYFVIFIRETVLITFYSYILQFRLQSRINNFLATNKTH